MEFDIELYHEGINLDATTPISPADVLEVTVEASETLKGIKIQIYDPKGNMRVMSRRKGNSAKFQTKFLNTKQEGVWSVKITGYGLDGDTESDTEQLLLKLNKDMNKLAPTDSVLEEPTATPDSDQTSNMEDIEKSPDQDEVVHDTILTAVETEKSAEITSDIAIESTLETEEREYLARAEENDQLAEVDMHEISTESELNNAINEEMQVESGLYQELTQEEINADSEVETSTNITDQSAPTDEFNTETPQMESTEPLTTITGIGKSTAMKLENAGINTIDQLAIADAEYLLSAGINLAQAETIILNAKEFLMKDTDFDITSV